MADLTIEEMKEYLKYAQELREAATSPIATDAVKNAFKSMVPHIEEYTKKLQTAGVSVLEFANDIKSVSFAAFITGLESVKGKVLNSIKDIDLFSNAVKGTAVSFGLLYAAASGRLTINDELVKMGGLADGTSAQMKGMFDNILKIAPEVGEKLGKVKELVGGAFGQVQAAKNMETSLLMNAAASGNLEAAYSSLTGGMKGLSDMTLEFSKLTSEAGTANNLTAAQAANYATQLMKIPGALGLVVDNADAGGNSMGMLDATMKVAAGTFQKFEKVMEDVDLLFLNWNKSGKEALTFVAKMSSAAQSLKMPMDIMRTYVKGVGEQFKFLGDNTNSAIDIMTRMGPALRKSGLGPDAIGQLVKGMTGAVAQMDVAQMSFISAQTGGPGGLQGGYQIEQQIAEGDVAGVMGKVEDTLRGMFGGQVVTLKQASEDARAAAQYTKQVQMLTTGPLKIAGSTGEAKAILDAMSKGEIFTPKGMGEATPEEQLHGAMEKGNELQLHQIDELVKINNTLSHGGVVAATEAYDKNREYLGTGTAEGAIKFEQQRKEASGAAAEIGFQKNTSKTTLAGEKSKIIDGGEELIDTISDAFRKLFDMHSEKNRELPGAGGAGGAAVGAKEFFGSKSGNAGLPGAQTRADMAVAQKMEGDPSSPIRGGKRPAQGGQSNTIVIQVKDFDDQIKRLINIEIDENNKMRMSEDGKVNRVS